MHSTDFHLTSRELAVVHLVARGLSAVEVAKELQIARCTVERHVENVRLKTRTRNRVHMIAYVIKQGMLWHNETERTPELVAH
ncbi:MAG: response regulator transcription factor [Sphingomonas oligoaromativorans]|jgi:DNA-binding NarL/FixJ family response regulator|uniref:response regulator transcription factor n=1 Tax=Sphingomonas oligoaromativorans TaxID=575322 RepID=UPI0014207946|nr:helix-turn-helix transcriptional regulator [Sphingomonas oligoaromativorans]NIJ32526.1 DNA-binding NarL/FixJ family response regulator [Sphingomonas oligoaromativorans]